MHYAEAHLKDMVQSEFDARDALAELFVAIAQITPAQASDLVDFYIRKKLVKFDRAMRRYTVKHGSYLDRDFIEHYAAHGAF
jgi:hypothetical protein